MTDDAEGPSELRPGESTAERHDRNGSGVLQELRVLPTGTQSITGFLLALWAVLPIAFRGTRRHLDAEGASRAIG
ncbi:DUF6328 family protein [Microbacterium betulae]|uniref:DUF6328 family protein n=1 Tax=Microbacterium betulae TaxID=2981139 RepID=UPI0037433D04